MKYTETKMFSEICQQPKVLCNLEKENKAVFERIAAEVKKRGIKNIIAVARGSSDNACLYFKYLTEIYCGIPVSFAAPSVYTLYNSNMKIENSLVIGVSQSGKAADAIEVLKNAKSAGSFTVSITNDVLSPMAQLTDAHLFLNAEKELSVAATKTFTAQLFTLALLSKYLGGGQKIADALAKVPAGIQSVIDNAAEIDKAAKSLINEKEAFILARGLDYAAALESCLKMQETTYTRARAYAASDFHHGPFAMIDENSVVILIMPKGESFADMKEMYEKCSAQKAKTICYTDSDVKGSFATIKIPSGSGIETPFYNVVTTQLLVNNLSVSRGLNPDAPRGLNKVTITK